jgi:hypothetical protein
MKILPALLFLPFAAIAAEGETAVKCVSPALGVPFASKTRLVGKVLPPRPGTSKLLANDKRPWLLVLEVNGQRIREPVELPFVGDEKIMAAVGETVDVLGYEDIKTEGIPAWSLEYAKAPVATADWHVTHQLYLITFASPAQGN